MSKISLKAERQIVELATRAFNSDAKVVGKSREEKVIIRIYEIEVGKSRKWYVNARLEADDCSCIRDTLFQAVSDAVGNLFRS